MKLFQNLYTGLAEEDVKSFFSIYSPGGHVNQRSRTVLAISAEGHPRNISVKLFQNPSIGLAEVV